MNVPRVQVDRDRRRRRSRGTECDSRLGTFASSIRFIACPSRRFHKRISCRNSGCVDSRRAPGCRGRSHRPAAAACLHERLVLQHRPGRSPQIAQHDHREHIRGNQIAVGAGVVARPEARPGHAGVGVSAPLPSRGSVSVGGPVAALGSGKANRSRDAARAATPRESARPPAGTSRRIARSARRSSTAARPSWIG